MDAAEAPVWGDLDQVRPLEAVRHNFIDILVEVQRVLAVSKVPATLIVEGKVEERLIKVEVVMKVSETMMSASIRVSVICLSITIIGGSLLLIC